MTRDQILTIARTWIGTRYHHQAAVKGAGCDCIGFIIGLYREVTGLETAAIPPYSLTWSEASREDILINMMSDHLDRIPINKAKPADMIVFRFKPEYVAKHAAVLSSQNTMIHTQERFKVQEVHLNPWWTRRITAAFRFRNVSD